MHIRTIGKVFFAIGFCVFAAFFGRFVVNAYITEPAAVQIRLTGVDLRTEIEESSQESPFSLESPDDLRRFPTDLGFISNPFVEQEPEDDAEEEKQEATQGRLPTGQLTPEEELVLGGEASIAGRVVGPEGPVEGATVRLERESDSGLGTLDVITDEEGLYEVEGLQGGRYRARAFVPSEFASASIETFFLDNISTDALGIDFLNLTKPDVFELNLQVRSQGQNILVEYVSGGNIFNGSTGLFGVSVTQQVVDPDGVIVQQPQSGFDIEIDGTPDYASLTNVTTTNSRGLAIFTARCEESTRGNHTGNISASKEVRELVPVEQVVVNNQSDEDAGNSVPAPDSVPTFRTVTLSDSVRVIYPSCVNPPPPPEPEPEAQDEAQNQGEDNNE